MEEINKAIKKHRDNSRKLKEIYLGDDSISYEKSLELQKKQDEEYKKMHFLINLRKELANIDKKGEK